MHRFLVTTLVAGFWTLPAHAAAVTDRETPENFVHRVYSHYRHDGPGISTLRPEGTPFYAAALLDAFARDAEAAQGEIGAVDGDPICACQDFDDLRVTGISVSAPEGTTVTADVEFIAIKKPEAVTLTLVRTPRGWRIADIADTNMKSLVALLRGGTAHPAQEPRVTIGRPVPQKP